MGTDVIYFELNNWFRGRDYPPGEPFDSWIRTYQLSNDDWCKENKICVRYGMIDMSDNYIITATREWVEKNCPSILAEYSDYMRVPDENGEVLDPICGRYKTYCEENIGITIQDGYLK